jgi:xanthine dehydrogenase YagT iron-sulfur-binding subunit
VIETGTSALLLTTLPRSAFSAGTVDDNGPVPPPMDAELQINGRSHSLTLDSPTTLLDALLNTSRRPVRKRVAITDNAEPARC